MNPRPWSLAGTSHVFAIALVGLGLSAAPARSEICPTPIAITSDVSLLAPGGPPVVYSVTPGSTRWSAIAARPNDAAVWAVEARDEPAAYPTCFSPILATSAVANLNFLVTDWHHRTAGTDYVAVGASGSPISARVEYSQAFFDGRTNSPFDYETPGPNDFLKVYDHNLFATIPYRIRIYPSAGLTALRVFVFAPIASGNGWARRTDRQAEMALTPGVENVLTYTPTVDGNHAIVILDENGASGSYYYAVGQCPFSNSGLADNVPRFNYELDVWPFVNQLTPTWGVVGVRGDPPYSYGLDLAASSNQYGPYPVCANTVFAAQDTGLGARFITGDYRSATLGSYPVHVELDNQPQIDEGGYMEWEGAADTLLVNGPPLSVAPPANNVLDAWSVRLAAGSTYGFQIKPDAGATAAYHLLLFRNPSPGSAYWTNRSGAVFQTTSAGGYTAPASDLYGVVVVNDDGGTGNYAISVHTGTAGADPPLATRTRIRSAAPNPFAGSTRITCELARGGRVALEVLDAAGRAVATLDLGVRPAGPVEVSWSPEDAAGRRAPAGLYLLVLRVDGKAVDRTKLMVLTAGAARVR